MVYGDSARDHVKLLDDKRQEITTKAESLQTALQEFIDERQMITTKAETLISDLDKLIRERQNPPI